MIIDSVKNAEIYTRINPNLKVALDFIKTHDISSMEPGRYPLAEGDVLVIIKKGYSTKNEEQCKWENHRDFLDIQYLLYGREKIGYCPVSRMQAKTPYDPESDKTLYNSTDEGFYTRLFPGDFVILFPDDVHMTLISDGEATINNKAVIKVKI